MRAAQLEPLVPYPGSAVKWKCRCMKCGKTVYPLHSSIKQGSGGCVHCGLKAAHAKHKLPEESAVKLMLDAGLRPLEPYRSAKSPWKCECLTCGALVVITQDSVKQGSGCSRCSTQAAARRRMQRYAADATRVMQDAGLEPLEPYPGTTRKWRCRCTRCGAEVSPTHNNVKQSGSGCRNCGIESAARKRRMDPGKALTWMQAAGFQPLDPYVSSNSPWRSRCLNCGRESTPMLETVRAGSKCKFCSGTAVVPHEAEQVMRDAELEPLNPFSRVNDPWPSKCMTCGREVSPSYSGVRSGKGCRYCSGVAVVPAEAEVIMRKHDFEPLTPYPGSLTPWPCKCLKCGKKSKPSFAMVNSQGTRCRYCQRIAVDPKDAERIMREGGFIPLIPYPGADSPWRCRCKKCKKEVAPTLGTVRAGGGCRYCATKGIDLNAPAIVYLITHDQLNAHKIGIGAPSGYRLKMHKKHGWEVYKTVELSTGDEAFEVERRVLKWLRLEMGLPPAVDRAYMPQRGETETVSADDISLPDLWKKIQSAVRNERRRQRRESSS
jgi:DNA-directed RNA polymerase subunit RPC12/RpoP